MNYEETLDYLYNSAPLFQHKMRRRTEKHDKKTQRM